MTRGRELAIGFGPDVTITAADGRGEASCGGTLTGTLRPRLGFRTGFSDGGCEGWYEIAFRLGIKLRRATIEATDVLLLLGDEKCGDDAGMGRGAKNGRFAALREFGGSSE
jgi:hypothetical protein